jgi:hypothetical protein
MVHKNDVIPGLSRFIDTAVLSQYSPTSLKRIAAAAAIAIFLQQNNKLVDQISNHPMFNNLHLINSDGMFNIELVRDVLKNEIAKAGFLRVSFPLLGDVDFIPDDVDTLYRCITSVSAPPS